MNRKIIEKKCDLDFDIITKIVDKEEFCKIKNICVEDGMLRWNIANVNDLSYTIVAYKEEGGLEEPVGFINVNRFSIAIENRFMDDKSNKNLFTNKGDIQVQFNEDPFSSYVYIDLVYVNPEYRWCGIGTLLYKSLDAILTESDCIYESRRSIDGRNANLLKNITKCMSFKYHEYEDMIMNL